MLVRIDLYSILLLAGPALAKNLVFSSRDRQVTRTSLRDTEAGITYTDSLSPERDVAGRPVVIDLVLTTVGATAESRTLLEPLGNWHGAQLFSFSAKEFKRNRVGGLFGAKRRISIQGSQKS
jgi:hypothetical protein